MDRLAKLHRETPTGETNDWGQILAWTEIARFYVSKTHQSEDEDYAAHQRYAKRVVTFGAHYRSDIKETDRIEVDGDTYGIVGIREIGRREGIEIKAEWTD
ncbi:phage head closure protein [Allorhizobium pseudoryzae]|uniref:phage head closure protein n=1 Tax=Allorhizobium pseudoryzae TaxID=379684 RepID=UPI003D03AE94